MLTVQVVQARQELLERLEQPMQELETYMDRR
jgi:hypothetical protein